MEAIPADSSGRDWPVPVVRVAAGAHLPDALAQAILARVAAGALPDQVVLVPAAGAAKGLREAFGRAAARRGQAAVFAPRIVTLEGWAATVALPDAVEGRRARLARLYDALRGRAALQGDGLWQVARALLAACDLLTAGVEPGEASAAALERAVLEAYRGRAAPNATFEVQLVTGLWRAMASARAGAPLDPGVALRLRIASLADGVAAPLWVCEHRPLAALPGPWVDFIARCARRVPVAVLAPEWDAARLALARAAWNLDGAGGALPLARRARGIVVADPPRLIHAGSLEAEADAVAAVVRAWVADGRRDIALVALDRLVARRARALLERDAILVADETGWPLSTTSAASALMRWLDCAAADFPQGDLVDLLRSPFVFATLDEGSRHAAAAAVDRVAREENLAGGLGLIRRALAKRAGVLDAAAPVRVVVDALERAGAQLDAGGGAARELSAWSDRLAASLDAIGLADGLAGDAAGAAVLDLLAALAEDARGAAGRYRFAEWRDWVAGALEEATFRDARVESPVVMTSLGALALRRFEGVVLIGADAARLGRGPAEPLFLGEGLAAALGLPDARSRGAALYAELAHLLGANDAVAVTWRDGERGEVAAPAAPFALLDAAHRVACGRPLVRRHRLPEPAAVPRGTAPAAPAAPRTLPALLSVSALQTLVECPYRFFARHLLGLDEEEVVREEFEKRDYGTWVHEVLRRFHARHAQVGGEDVERLAADLRAIADQVFAEPIAFNHLSLGWKLRFAARIPAYLAWQRAWEEQRWRHGGGELRHARALFLPGGRRVDVAGRLDRVDVMRSVVDGHEDCAIIDYKTRDEKALRKSLQVAGEDVQLPLYAWLHGAAGQAMYLALDSERVQVVPADGTPALRADDEAARFAAALGAIDGGARLPAHGAERTCARCEMRGLCRRDFATEVAAA
jgi:ATP-dependent helicase/nuclease subunit B